MRAVCNLRPGIYAVNGIIAFPVNIVVIRELEDKELLALKIMERRADEEEVKLFLQETRKLTEQGDRRHADAVLQISAKINRELYKKLRGENMCEALREIMAEDLKEAEKIGEKRGEKRGIKKGIDLRDKEKITEMLNSGKTPEAIADFCQYPLTQVMSVYKSLKEHPASPGKQF